MELDKDYWQNRYLQANTPWDIGQVSPPLKTYMDTLMDKDLRILIPGAGAAHEATYLYRAGFRQVYVCDWAEQAFEYLLSAEPGFPREQLLCGDFFQLLGEYDLVLEQTFFCAINPSLRSSYVSKAASLLPRDGKLAGLLFASHFEKDGPPYGGTEMEYRELFAPDFNINRLEIAKNSILPRAQNELFFEFIRK